MNNLLSFLRTPPRKRCGACGNLIEPGRSVRFCGILFCSTECATDDFEFSGP